MDETDIRPTIIYVTGLRDDWRRLGEAGGAAGLRRRFDALVDEAGFDAELARGWTLLRAVDYWLWGLHHGLTEDPALCTTVIDWLSLAGRP
ncbi:MAG TPA: hypothetical protein VMR00_20990 [Streptosporangiaceae bacterium]|nr:hypothetical protein [Streptosporangiaceae bacterium]